MSTVSRTGDDIAALTAQLEAIASANDAEALLGTLAGAVFGRDTPTWPERSAAAVVATGGSVEARLQAAEARYGDGGRAAGAPGAGSTSTVVLPL